MKITIEPLDFPSEIKNKLKMKVSMANLKIEFCKMKIAHLQKNKPYWFQTKDLHGYQEDIELIEEQICEYYRLINNEVKLIDKIRDKILKENS